jgi:hypothetical protein
MATQAINLETLALELLTNIARYLLIHDLKTIRLVSSHFDCATQIELFRNMFLYLTWSTFERLLEWASIIMIYRSQTTTRRT